MSGVGTNGKVLEVDVEVVTYFRAKFRRSSKGLQHYRCFVEYLENRLFGERGRVVTLRARQLTEYASQRLRTSDSRAGFYAYHFIKLIGKLLKRDVECNGRGTFIQVSRSELEELVPVLRSLVR
ncbi:MAG: hypothetical protein DRJ40_08300 [Thermoprotei archaeon]|nr:MAG: hypothetical protein DRJ40_08300 [Thermoprotei archaeon]